MPEAACGSRTPKLWAPRARRAEQPGQPSRRRALARRLIIPRLTGVFAASPRAERELLAELPATLDRIDAWIAGGALGGTQLNAADFMVVPSLVLMLYRSDVQPLFGCRPALELVDRLLPEPP